MCQVSGGTDEILITDVTPDLNLDRRRRGDDPGIQNLWIPDSGFEPGTDSYCYST